MANNSANNWMKAKSLVVQCSRCVEWQKSGLGNYCPTCDAAVLEKFDELEGNSGKLPDSSVASRLESDFERIFGS